jgi:hypothetical protein
MKRKKVLIKNELSNIVYSDRKIKISKYQGEWFFELGSEITSDLAEAVSILIRQIDFNHPVWDLELKEVSIDDIFPEKALFWLTGGYSEWRSLEHYNRPWCDCYLEFQEEFGFIIINTVKRSKKLSEIRDNFIKYLNLPTLYDFALSKDFIR